MFLLFQNCPELDHQLTEFSDVGKGCEKKIEISLQVFFTMLS